MLNFFDDKTHVRIYSTPELFNTLLSVSCSPLKGGQRRSRWNIIFLPVNALKSKIRNGHIRGHVFWDLLGFAEYVIAKRN
jgi:hypothetical protein